MLLNDLHPGLEKSEIVWYPEPHYKSKIHGDEKIEGTFRSSSCKRTAPLGTLKDGMCYVCSKIPTLQSFKKRIIDRKQKSKDGSRDTQNIRHQYLTSDEIKEKLKSKQQKIEKKESELFFSESKRIRLNIRSRSMAEKLTEYARRGSMKSICKNLQKAADDKILEDKNVLLDTLRTVGNNLVVKKNGRRYQASTRLFYEVIMLWGGPRLATFVALNLFGPQVHSIYRWRKEQKVNFELGLKEDNFKKLADIYRNIMKLKDIPKVPFQASEDETGIVGKVSYAQDTDMLYGFCGVDGANHNCLDEFVVTVGQGQEGYNTILNAFQNFKIGTYARAILVNPIHKDLPKFPILIMPTCNKFNHQFVFRQWQSIERLFIQYLEPVLGTYIGNASDGDSRRRKLMLQLSLCPEGDRFRPIPMELGFVFSCRKDNKEDGGEAIRDLCDQDYVHNHKKLINCLDHTARVLMMGRYLVHLNHLHLVYSLFPFNEHGLSADDINRRDRQNWRSAQKLSFLRIQNLLQRIVDGYEGSPPNPSVKGTLTYLKIIWLYVEIFCSEVASLKTRVTYAGTVCHFLAIWHNYIVRTPELTKKTNFIPRETYSDVELSCQFAVMIISYMRDHFPGIPCQLDLTGTDVVEDFWSRNGQWVGNRHNYTFGDLRRNLSHMIRLDAIRTDPNAPEFAKPHPKQESIWKRQYAHGYQKADTTVYPSELEAVEAWRRGMQDARRMARDVGMGPDDWEENDNGEDDDPDDDDNYWFFKPFKGNIFQHDPSWDVDDDRSSDDSLSNDDEHHGGHHGRSEVQSDEAADLVSDGLEMNETFSNILSIDDREDDGHGSQDNKIDPVVKVPDTDTTIYKSILTEMLNEDPHLSKDRLTRVRQRQNYQGPATLGADKDEVGLFDDYAILYKKTKSFVVGNVVRMQCNSTEYKRPVKLDDIRAKEIEVTVNLYQPMNNEKSIYNGENTVVDKFKICDFLSPVNLSIHDDGNLHILENELDEIKSALDNIFRVPDNRPQSETMERTQFQQDEGIRRTVITPNAENENGQRRSKRSRTVVTYMT